MISSIFTIFICINTLLAQSKTIEKIVVDKNTMEKVIKYRRHIHQYPELSDEEVKTAAYIKEILKEYEVPFVDKIARNGIVAYIKGNNEDKVVALRADMDALPVQEMVDLPFKSVEKSVYSNKEVYVMHSCGHDLHVAMLLGAMIELVKLKKTNKLNGSVLLLFQPAEESSFKYDLAGAELMLKEGAFSLFKKPQAVFGIHVGSRNFKAGENKLGRLTTIPGPAMAASPSFQIKITGRQAHGSTPWIGNDPIIIASNFIQLTQQIVSRKANLLKSPLVITFGSIHGGIRHNIIPDVVELSGTIRTFDESIKQLTFDEMENISKSLEKLHRAKIELTIKKGYPVTINDPGLYEKIKPFISNLEMGEKSTGAEDFSFFANAVPAIYYGLNVTPDTLPKEIPKDANIANHSPYFIADESTMEIGVRTHLESVLGFFQL